MLQEYHIVWSQNPIPCITQSDQSPNIEAGSKAADWLAKVHIAAVNCEALHQQTIGGSEVAWIEIG